MKQEAAARQPGQTEHTGFRCRRLTLTRPLIAVCPGQIEGPL